MTTPTPWGIEETTNTIYVGPLRRDNSGKIAEIVYATDIFCIKDEFVALERANAELITDAVNNHAEMQAILTGLVRLANDGLRPQITRGGHAEETEFFRLISRAGVIVGPVAQGGGK